MDSSLHGLEDIQWYNQPEKTAELLWYYNARINKSNNIVDYVNI